MHLANNYKMAKYLSILSLCLLTLSCLNQKKENGLNLTDQNKIKQIESIHPSWFEFYEAQLSDYKNNKFELISTCKQDSLPSGNILTDSDKNYNPIYSEFAIFSPDSLSYLDLDSYQMILIRNEDQLLICEGMEIDQEVNWVNRKTNKVKRLAFCGSACRFEDAKWLDNSQVVLFGICEKKLCLKLIDLQTLEYRHFSYPDTLMGTRRFAQEVRMKHVSFN